MKVRFFCVGTHGGGAWKRFDFTVQCGGNDCPKGNAVLYATDQEDFLGFKQGRMYDAAFTEVQDEQGQVREEPQAHGPEHAEAGPETEGAEEDNPEVQPAGILS